MIGIAIGVPFVRQFGGINWSIVGATTNIKTLYVSSVITTDYSGRQGLIMNVKF